MKSKRTATRALALAASVAAFLPLAPVAVATETAVRPARQAVVQLAVLLDTSSSMDGLIDQARTRLWQIVNDLATARHAGLRPRLEVALYEYGNSGLSSESNYIRQVVAFTDDLDELSARLFALRTNGGSEYCGAVIDHALGQLAWSNHHDDLKLVFIAGNEEFTQGPIDYRVAVRAAAARGVVVNTIYCCPEQHGVNTGWKDGAVLADGTFASIDQNHVMPHIDAPQDREIATLNASLNTTYLAYGAAGAARAERQLAEDANALAASPGVAAQRATAKASDLYNNASWDLVDAVNRGAVQLDQLKPEEMPAALRDLPADGRRAKIDALAAERKRIQERIQALATEREAFVTAELQKLAAASGNNAAALDQAILQSVRAQAEKKNYEFAR